MSPVTGLIGQMRPREIMCLSRNYTADWRRSQGLNSGLPRGLVYERFPRLLCVLFLSLHRAFLVHFFVLLQLKYLRLPKIILRYFICYFCSFYFSVVIFDIYEKY